MRRWKKRRLRSQKEKESERLTTGFRICLPKVRPYDIIDIKYIIWRLGDGLTGVDQGG
jgi:hypothetical protein